MAVGEALTRAREERGLSVDEVSRQTCIRASLIRAIEADDFASCGGDVYARGHLRSIAKVVGVDADPLVEEYDRERGGPPGGPVPLAPFDPEVATRTERRRPNWAAAMVVALLVVCGLAAAQLVSSGSPSKDGGQPAVAGASASTSPSAAAPSPAPSATVAPQPVVAQRSGVTVALRVVRDRTWLSVKDATGRLVFQGLLAAGQARSFHDAKLLTFVIGNAPVVSLVVNGKSIGSPPSQGNVARVSFGPDDPNGSAG